jgi:hypothetical protein
VIRVERAPLPDGLKAIAYRDRDGNLVVCVAEGMNSAGQRAAVIEAMRAARRVGWRAGLPPAGIALFLAALDLLHRATRPLKARPTAWAATATATATIAAATAYFLVTPPHPGSPAAGQPPPGVVAPAVPPSQRTAPPGGPRSRPDAAPARSPGHAGLASPASASGVVAGTGQTTGSQPGQASKGGGTPPSSPPPPGSAPSPTPSTQPAPGPTPIPSGRGSGLCVTLLGLNVCLQL